MLYSCDRFKLKAMTQKDGGRDGAGRRAPDFLTMQEVNKARRFHQSLPGYQPTPLVNLTNLAQNLGVGHIYLKDESQRFGLNAFKVLGSSYAMGKHIGSRLGLAAEMLTFDHLSSDEVLKGLGRVTFATATDGNHGRAVAWTAQQLGQPAVVYLPKGAARRRVEVIEETGAKAVVTDVNYDDTVRMVREAAVANRWQLIQDTAWEGYEEIPRWIMQGYTVLAAEAVDQLEKAGLPQPSHVFLQAGVGSFASSIVGYFVNRDAHSYPSMVIMEPEQAACIYQSALVGDRKTQTVKGDLNTIMAGLSCGEPSPVAWEILRSWAHGYVVCPDYVAAQGIRILANPLGDDQPIIAGESGSVGIGLLSILCREIECRQIKDAFGLNEDSRILVINTEGDTDPVNYRRILWDGKYPLV